MGSYASNNTQHNDCTIAVIQRNTPPNTDISITLSTEIQAKSLGIILDHLRSQWQTKYSSRDKKLLISLPHIWMWKHFRRTNKTWN